MSHQTKKNEAKAMVEFLPFAQDVLKSLNQALDFYRGTGKARVTEFEILDEAPKYQAQDIVAIRKGLGMTQARFARVMNVSVQSIEGWEAGKKSPGPSSRRLIQVYSDPGTLAKVAYLTGYRVVKSAKPVSATVKPTSTSRSARAKAKPAAKRFKTRNA